MADRTSLFPYLSVKRTNSGISPVMFVIIIVAIIFVMSLIFRVEDIRVVGNSHYTDSEIINAIDIEEGDNLFFFDRFAAISRVFAKLPYVESVSITRNLPNRVTIEVVENTAMAYLRLGTELWTLDQHCKVLGKAAEGEEENLIEITGLTPGTLFVNEPLQTADSNSRITEYLKAILTQIKKRGITQIKRIDMTNENNVKMYYDNLYTIYLGDPYQTEHKFALMVSCISQLLAGDSGYIDVSDAATVHFRPY